MHLQSNDALQNSIPDLVPGYIFLVDATTYKSIYSNNGLEPIIGYSIQELEAMGTDVIKTIIHPEDVNLVIQGLMEYKNYKKDEIYELEYRVIHKSGKVKWVSRKSRVFTTDDEGKSLQIIGIINDITDKKEIESKLLQSKRSYKEIQALSHVGNYKWTKEENIIFWSDEMFRIYGFEPGELELLPEKIEQYVHPDSIEYRTQLMNQLVSKEGQYSYEHKILKKDGSTGYISGTVVSIFDSHAQPYEIIGYAQDVTEKKLIEEKLIKLNAELEDIIKERTADLNQEVEKFKMLTETIPQLVWYTSFNKRPTYFNQQWNTFSGQTVNNIQDWMQLVHPEDVELAVREWRNAVQHGTEFRYEFRMRRYDGEYRWFLSVGKPLKDESGNIDSWIGTATEIHQQKETERSLKMYGIVLDSMSEGVSVTDENGIIVYTNPAEDKIFGYTKGELIGCHVSIQNNYPEEENVRIINEVIRELNEKGEWLGEWQNKRKDGTPFVTFARITTILLNGKTHFVCVQEDITDKKIKDKAIQDTALELQKVNKELLVKNKELVKTNNDLDNFIYTASHDLKAPVSNIEGLIHTLEESLQEKQFIDSEISQVINFIKQSVIRFQNTIRDLTEISKIQRNTNDDITTIRIAEIINEVLGNLNKMVRETEAAVNLDIPEKLSLNFSVNNLRSILHNLVSNAIKYRSPERSPMVNIAVKDDDQFIRISVKDNGLGFGQEHKEKIFGMFKRLHTHVEGTGVGLYIVKKIIDNCNGKIEVESEPDKGTSFTLYFPKENDI
ncbi:MAG: PAS domain-containing protein [Cytophagaceae bacterium]